MKGNDYVKALADGEITERGLREELNLKLDAELLGIIGELEGKPHHRLKGIDHVSLRNYAVAAIIKKAEEA